jgi:hypothetical protein
MAPLAPSIKLAVLWNQPSRDASLCVDEIAFAWLPTFVVVFINAAITLTKPSQLWRSPGIPCTKGAILWNAFISIALFLTFALRNLELCARTHLVLARLEEVTALLGRGHLDYLISSLVWKLQRILQLESLP